MDKKRRLTIAIRIIAGSFLMYWIFQLGSSFYSATNEFKLGIASKRPAKDYSYDYLFKKEKFTTGLTYYNRGKEPLSTYTYDKKMTIAILEMQGVYTKPINDVVSIHKKSTDISSNVTYNTSFRQRLVELRRISSPLSYSGANLNLNLYGDSIRLEENTDQMIYYRLKLENASITYGNSDLINFHIGKKGFFSNKPVIEMMLKKYNQKIYLILAIPKKDGVVIPKNLLLSILKE